MKMENICSKFYAAIFMTIVFVVSAQASEPATQEKNKINLLNIGSKTDIENYDTLNYIGLDNAKQQLSVFKEKSQTIYDKYLYRKNIPYGLGVRESVDHFHNPKNSLKKPRCIYFYSWWLLAR